MCYCVLMSSMIKLKKEGGSSSIKYKFKKNIYKYTYFILASVSLVGICVLIPYKFFSTIHPYVIAKPVVPYGDPNARTFYEESELYSGIAFKFCWKSYRFTFLANTCRCFLSQRKKQQNKVKYMNTSNFWYFFFIKVILYLDFRNIFVYKLLNYCYWY